MESVVTATRVAEGLFNGVAQVFFQGSVVTGVLFLIGLPISSRRIFVAALLGSLTGSLVAWGMGAAEPAIRSAVFGFNCVLMYNGHSTISICWNSTPIQERSPGCNT